MYSKIGKNLLTSLKTLLKSSGAPLTYFNDGGTGCPSDFFGCEILAQSDFGGSMKDAGTFLDRQKKQRDFFGLRKRTKGSF